MSKIGGAGGSKLPPIVRNNTESLKPTLKIQNTNISKEGSTSQISLITKNDLSEALKNLGFPEPKALQSSAPLTDFQKDIHHALKDRGLPIPRGITVQ